MEFTEVEERFIAAYDKKDFGVWGSDAEEMKSLRAKIKKHLLQKQDYTCCYCLQRRYDAHGATWDIDHVAPKSRNPHFLFEINNLALSCKECNISKSENETLKHNRKTYPSNGAPFKIIHPHYDDYKEHIEIVKLGATVLYRAKNKGKGRVTYSMCNLIRFDYEYGGWKDFGGELVNSVLGYIDALEPGSTLDDFRALLPVLMRAARG